VHRLLAGQVERHLSRELAADPAIRELLRAVDATYRQAESAASPGDPSAHGEQAPRDVSALQKLEIELRQADKLRAIGQLAAGISHELNTPIQYIGDSVRFMEEAYQALLGLRSDWDMLCAEIARGGPPAGALATLRARADEADLDYFGTELAGAFVRTHEGLARMTRILGSLKAFAKPSGHERPPTDVNACLRSALAVAGHAIHALAEVQLSLAELPLVACNPGELNQVFLHLLMNAAQAIEARARAAGEKGTIRVTNALEARHVLVTIADDGCGIAPEHAARVFEPFFTTKAVDVGAGQGLAFAHAIVVGNHGGSLTFTSALNVGTAFHVRLPLT
jgi:signal transduction histidine kinase